MTIEDLVRDYVLHHELGTHYRQSLKRTTKRAREAGIREVSDLTSGTVSKMIEALSSSFASVTVSNVRRELLTLWRWALEQAYTDEQPLRVRRVRVKSPPPQAWSLSDLGRMLTAAEADTTSIGGTMNQVRVCDLLPCWISVGYETGLRFTDMHGLRFDNIVRGCVVTTAAKTGKPLVRSLSPRTLDRANGMRALPTDGTLFAWALTRRRAFRVWRDFLDRHGFSGSTRWLRRSCATYVEAMHPGASSSYLQHSSTSLVARHYLDQSLICPPAGPPEIR